MQTNTFLGAAEHTEFSDVLGRAKITGPPCYINLLGAEQSILKDLQHSDDMDYDLVNSFPSSLIFIEHLAAHI